MSDYGLEFKVAVTLKVESLDACNCIAMLWSVRCQQELRNYRGFLPIISTLEVNADLVLRMRSELKNLG